MSDQSEFHNTRIIAYKTDDDRKKWVTDLESQGWEIVSYFDPRRVPTVDDLDGRTIHYTGVYITKVGE
jgi:hypothetical protein